MTSADLVGTWTSDHDGSVTFADDGTVTATGIPYRGYVDEPDADETPVDDTGSWNWFDVGELTTHGWKQLCIDFDSGEGGCIWQIRGSRVHRELDLVVGDPDSVDWYRYAKTTAD